MADFSPKRGLSALLQKTSDKDQSGSFPQQSFIKIPISSIIPNPDQPRKEFSEDELLGLGESIKSSGVIQPIIVRAAPKSIDSQVQVYEIIAGERRWRAAKHIGLESIPALVKEVSSTNEVMLMSLIENIQRKDLNPIEEAQAFYDKQATDLSKEGHHLRALVLNTALPAK